MIIFKFRFSLPVLILTLTEPEGLTHTINVFPKLKVSQEGKATHGWIRTCDLQMQYYSRHYRGLPTTPQRATGGYEHYKRTGGYLKTTHDNIVEDGRLHVSIHDRSS